MKILITLLAWSWCLLKFIIVGAFIQKWKMQSVFNYADFPKIAPVYEVQCAWYSLIVGIAGVLVILFVKKESEL
ncbi:hypothetical protein KAR91_83125 [Candidatus Pacearchaeota archaeon]|nr:hypothetical protein [Candidatus Pacearchaeota archaeon]